MISAWGVDHGGVSKSYKKLAPKLGRLRNHPKPDDTFADRMKVNYVQGREHAGYLGRREVNPNKWAKEDAKNLADFGPPHPRVVQSREQSRLRALDKAKSRKQFARASVDAHANNTKPKRFLP